jgi:hypothetical protein
VQNLPIILIEVVLVFGGVLAFGWWQLRDLARERARREQGRAVEAAEDSIAFSPQPPQDAADVARHPRP